MRLELWALGLLRRQEDQVIKARGPRNAERQTSGSGFEVGFRLLGSL